MAWARLSAQLWRRSYADRMRILTDAGVVLALITVRNGMGDNLGDAFIRIDLGPGQSGFTRGDCNPAGRDCHGR